MTPTQHAERYRWLALAVFMLSSAINYLERQTLAALAPALEAEFHLSRMQFGWIVGVFSATYAASAPFAGILVDRIGLNRAASLAIGVWSCAGIATGFTSGLRSLMGCRIVLGAAEAGGIPAAGKAIHQYSQPHERALGNALNQAGVSLGAILAPPIAVWIAANYGWRNAFVLTGILGLLWIPLWNFTARRIDISSAPKDDTPTEGAILLRNPRLWAFMLANALGMVGYSLWTNYTTQFLVDVHHLALRQTAAYAWIPPVFMLSGGFAGGWMSRAWIKRGVPTVTARFRACLFFAILALGTAAVPLTTTPAWSSAAISVGLFAVAAFSVNMYSLPLDAFGGKRAGFAISMLVAAYGAIQLVTSPAFGSLMDHHHWSTVTSITALTPLAACAVLWFTKAAR